MSLASNESGCFSSLVGTVYQEKQGWDSADAVIITEEAMTNEIKFEIIFFMIFHLRNYFFRNHNLYSLKIKEIWLL